MSLSSPAGTKMFQFPAFALPTLYIQVGLTDGKVRRVSAFRNLRINACLPASRSISQATTSFVASRCQDIHHTPLVTCPNLSITVIQGSTTLFVYQARTRSTLWIHRQKGARRYPPDGKT